MPQRHDIPVIHVRLLGPCPPRRRRLERCWGLYYWRQDVPPDGRSYGQYYPAPIRSWRQVWSGGSSHQGRGGYDPMILGWCCRTPQLEDSPLETNEELAADFGPLDFGPLRATSRCLREIWKTTSRDSVTPLCIHQPHFFFGGVREFIIETKNNFVTSCVCYYAYCKIIGAKYGVCWNFFFWGGRKLGEVAPKPLPWLRAW